MESIFQGVEENANSEGLRAAPHHEALSRALGDSELPALPPREAFNCVILKGIWEIWPLPNFFQFVDTT